MFMFYEENAACMQNLFWVVARMLLVKKWMKQKMDSFILHLRVIDVKN